MGTASKFVAQVVGNWTTCAATVAAQTQPVQKYYTPKGDKLIVHIRRKQTDEELLSEVFPVYGRVAVTPSLGVLWVNLQDEDAQGRTKNRAPWPLRFRSVGLRQTRSRTPGRT